MDGRIMNLEQQVTSLEMSKKLKSLNVKQDSIFYHYYEEKIIGGNDLSGDEIRTDLIAIHNEDLISAFTAAELLEMLPCYLDDAGSLKIEKHDVTGEGITYFIEYGYGYYDQQDKKLSNALAKILIHLIENSLIGGDSYVKDRS